MTAFAYETYHLGLRTTRRFIRVPANWISIIFFPLIQLLIFSQLYQDIVQVPGFGGEQSYLAYLAPGQVVVHRVPGGRRGRRLRDAGGVPIRLPGQAARAAHQPLVDPGRRDGAALLPGRRDGRRGPGRQPAAGRHDRHGRRSASCCILLWPACSAWPGPGPQLHSGADHQERAGDRARCRCSSSRSSSCRPRSCRRS